MTKLKSLLIGTAAVVLISAPVSLAVAQSALSIGDNDSVLIDGNSFTIVPGKGKGGASTLITKLGAQALGPGAVVFRSGDKLYIAGTGPIEGVRLGSDRYGGSRNDYGSDRYGGSRNDYGSDRGDRGGIKIGPLGQCFDPRGCDDYASGRYGGSRNDYGSDRFGGSRNDYGSDRYGGSRNDYGSDRYGGSRNDYGSDRYGGSRNDYASDRYGGSRNDYGSDRYGGERVVIDDPDYAQYKLKKIFQDNWTPIESK